LVLTDHKLFICPNFYHTWCQRTGNIFISQTFVSVFWKILESFL